MYRKNYKDGKEHGPLVSYNKDGKRDGAWASYHGNGKLKSRGTFKDGKKVGTWVTFDKEWAVIPEGTGIYENDKKVK